MPFNMNTQNTNYYGSTNFEMQNFNCCETPIVECPQEQICHKEYVHTVPHVVPINIKTINHHIYKHSYSPCFSYSEENVVCNMYDEHQCNNHFKF